MLWYIDTCIGRRYTSPLFAVVFCRQLDNRCGNGQRLCFDDLFYERKAGHEPLVGHDCSVPRGVAFRVMQTDVGRLAMRLDCFA